MKDQGREVRGIGNQIAFAGEQTAELRSELVVERFWRLTQDYLIRRNSFFFEALPQHSAVRLCLTVEP